MALRFSLGSARQWHWISGAITLVGMAMFAITGITLNHAADIPGQHQVVTIEAPIAAPLLAQLKRLPEGDVVLPARLRDYFQTTHEVTIAADQRGQWDGIEFYLAMARPGGDAWLAIDAELGEFIYEGTDRGWIAYFNDLHKGRDTGSAWRWFLDIFSVACLVFCITGLQLLLKQSQHRAMTWPVTALGVVIPTVLLLVFV
ncbi:PepSY-associated TM helix domain-containing protein [Pseudidiomarina sediminum]|uniref:PepSY-associated TM helix domain-containing protein n=1 Tax=Pseudidiomarina sediminum TaxID=431675 RepID=UPI001C958C62|nr:PepSY-associated TM helix domain-containing protein [Pseudidiomarina sediminum]MBY6064489.1 PepSY-associated TM helix domain-containing protein [Pseudidiomarina sediminum]